MLVTIFPNLNVLANICLTIPVSTASVERSFSQTKLIKTRLRNNIGNASLNYLMLIAIESPNVLNDSEFDCIVDIWKEKPRRSICCIDCLIVWLLKILIHLFVMCGV